MKKIKIIDKNFAHTKFTSDYQVSKYIEWDRSQFNSTDTVFITDYMLPKYVNLDAKKIALIIEPRVIIPQIYEWIKDNHHMFKTVLTYDKQLLELIPNAEFYPFGGCWIKVEDQRIYEKTKILSIVASSKTQTFGHRLRHQAVSSLKNSNIEIDTYGTGYTQIEYKLDALKQYAFSIVIENCSVDFCFTEKLIDAFVTGTVPIYWGCPSIGRFFNLDGMILIEKLSDISKQASSLTFDRYASMQNAIEENFHKAKEYLLLEDQVFKNGKIF